MPHLNGLRWHHTTFFVKVVERFGEGVKIYGSGKGGRRGTIESQEYSVAGKGDFLRLKFYVDGTECKGTVHGEFRKVDGNWKCRWMFLDAGQSMVHRESPQCARHVLRRFCIYLFGGI